jgi:uncharacterized membrane protein HdeD (DUF308 family)
VSQSSRRDIPFSLRIDTAELSRPVLRGIRVALAISGAVAVILGIAVLVAPGRSLAVVAVLFGIYFIVIGLIRAISGIVASGAGGASRVLNIVLGILVFALGVVSVRNPALTIALLAVLVGVAWVIEGIAALFSTTPDRSRWFGVLFGIVSIIAGITVLVTPLLSALVLATIGGFFLLVAGIAQLVQAVMFGRRRATA